MRILYLILLACCFPLQQWAQEIDARITINHNAISGTSKNVFEVLERSLSSFVNERQWTNFHYRPAERLQLSLNFTLQKYDEAEQTMEAALSVSLTRPVFGSSYSTVIFANRDTDCRFRFAEFDKLEFRPEAIDNDLTAIVAYYVYLAIGIDLDCMSPKGGTDALQQALVICQNAQGLQLSAKGWKAFEDGKNRYAIVADWLDGAMEAFRLFHYQYYRQGLDVMSENTERARSNIGTAFEQLALAVNNKSLSQLPLLLTEYKADEWVNIYKGHGTLQEKETIIKLLSKINPSKNTSWMRIRN